jgi:hypothetical protein
LPKLNGRQVLACAKGNADLRGIPVVVLMSSIAEQDIVQSDDLGAGLWHQASRFESLPGHRHAGRKALVHYRQTAGDG